MTKKISFFVVTVAAVTLVLSGCGKGPAPDMDDDMEMPSLDGTWVFAGFSAMIDGTAVTVTVGDGTMSLPTANPAFAAVTQIVAKGNLALEGTAYKLTLSEEADAIIVMLFPGVAEMHPTAEAVAIGAIKTLIEPAQAGEVDIKVEDDVMTVKGSFLDMLVGALGMQVPEAGLMGCKDDPCAAS
jgi:hypothetical protein